MKASCRLAARISVLFFLGGAFVFRIEGQVSVPAGSVSSKRETTVPGPGAFHLVAGYQGRGRVEEAMVGPGPTPGSEGLYSIYEYADNSAEIVYVDSETGQWQEFQIPVKGEDRAAMAVGPDGKVYIGTGPHAHLLRFDPTTKTFTDLGQPSPKEQYIWQLTVGADRNLYGGTYPSAKLIRYDPATGRSEDLGRMDPEEMYARQVAASDGGFIYIGIGYGKARLVAYEIQTGRHQNLLPDSITAGNVSEIHPGPDRKIYVKIDGGQVFRVEGWKATPIAPAEFAEADPRNRLKDGRLMSVDENVVRLEDPKTHSATEFPFTYPGGGLPIFRLAGGFDGLIYGSTELPIHLFSVDAAKGTVNVLASLGDGEIYSILRCDSRLCLGGYGGLSALMVFDPGRPFALGAGGGANPVLVHFAGENIGWRPEAMIRGPGDKIYVGAIASYGALGGPLVVWDPVTNQLEVFPQLVHDQSVVSLSSVGGLIVGGTTIYGGGGSRPTQSDAKLFMWDPRTREKILEIVPVPGMDSITALITAPSGLVYGVAGESTLFAFDPAVRKVVRQASLPFTIDHNRLFNCVAIGPDERIWGLADQGVFVLDWATGETRLVAGSPEPISAGFALERGNLYFGSGANVYRYMIDGY